MKKLLLSVLLFGALSAGSVWSQSCTPGANFVDSSFGVWPDTTQNFPPAAANVFYSTDLNFKVPSTVTAEIDASGQFVGSPIQSFTVTGVQGLPTGYNYACNITSCTYNGGSNGCANVYGTTATTGLYPVTIDVDATVLVTLFPGLPPTPVTQSVSFSGYKVSVGTAGQISLVTTDLSVVPNPSNGSFKLTGMNSKLTEKITITKINGQLVYEHDASNQSELSIDISNVNAGMYFVNVLSGDQMRTLKIIKE